MLGGGCGVGEGVVQVPDARRQFGALHQEAVVAGERAVAGGVVAPDLDGVLTGLVRRDRLGGGRARGNRDRR